MATKATLTKATRAGDRKREADEALKLAVRAALADGHTVRTVAAATGLSVGTVHALGAGA